MKARGISQTDLANRIGVDKSQMSRLQNGLSWPHEETLLALAKELQIDPEALISGERKVSILDALFTINAYDGRLVIGLKEDDK